LQEELKVDEKGRIQVPKKIRERLGIKNTVKASVKGHSLIIEAEEDPLKELEKIVISRFKDIEKELPALRKAAEEQALKEL
jgi:AbrB family looped-hinge helix DNA binding protein